MGSNNDFLRCVGFDSHADSRLLQTYRPKETATCITAAVAVFFQELNFTDVQKFCVHLELLLE